MPDHSSDDLNAIFAAAPPPRSDAAVAVDERPLPDEDPSPRRRRKRGPRRTDWRMGGRSVLRWREGLIAWACICLGAGVLAGVGAQLALPGELGSAVAMVLLWIGMLVPVVVALMRSRPIRLFRFRGVDVLYGLVIGVALRIAQGWLTTATGGSGALPSYPSLSGGWAFTDLFGPVVVSPVVEEFFFRAVVLVAVYTALRRPVGKVAAGVAAGLVSTALFVFAHSISPIGPGDAIALGLVGVVTAAIVLLSGRIWGAVLVHFVYNVSFVVLALAGTYLG
ncbi:CPBP family intramembrane metalloprotease [Microbacterium horticulturae]|uniref:CPBP family intramembrane metalloprotease n=1 Tax=Microbacterium horticulturae TaxID=3028316 RepID=A0ABY8BWC0_9MICO|nr:CPBP family intramembrane glutamic endopeptidase [Microbacterium sp. KACC 23027]WEG08157.1 CPBP family intramembrane metalloprotease [Microbacterium sp. KACC 23027]